MPTLRPRTLQLTALASLLLATAGLFVAAGCGPKPTSSVGQADTAAVAKESARLASMKREYVGNEACVECHAAEFESHKTSGHALSLSLGDPKTLGKLAPKEGPIPGTKYRVKRDASGLILAADGYPKTARKVDLVIGSGRSGVSFIAAGKGGGDLERLRLTYAPPTGKWYVHPGQEGLGLYDPPVKVTGSRAKECILCHATALKEGTLIPERKFLGVGCESCHGPASAHIESRKVPGIRELYIEQFSTGGARRINEMCGRCHGMQNASNDTLTSEHDTRRWTANALMQSRCFWQSGEALSCANCHNPHGSKPTTRAEYDAACLRCHGPAPPPRLPDGTSAGKGNPCPVNPKGKCVSCHMKSGQFFEHSDISSKMTDHYIHLPQKLIAPP